MAPLSILDQISIASPCPASWADMVGDDRTRFCSGCRKSVHNIASMTDADAMALLQSSGSGICLRIYRRQDGTVLTADCPVGLRARASARLRRIAGGLTAVAAVLFAGLTLKARMDEESAGTTAAPVAWNPTSMSWSERLSAAFGLRASAPTPPVGRFLMGESAAVPCPTPASALGASTEISADAIPEGSQPDGPADHPE